MSDDLRIEFASFNKLTCLEELIGRIDSRLLPLRCGSSCRRLRTSGDSCENNRDTSESDANVCEFHSKFPDKRYRSQRNIHVRFVVRDMALENARRMKKECLMFAV